MKTNKGEIPVKVYVSGMFFHQTSCLILQCEHKVKDRQRMATRSCCCFCQTTEVKRAKFKLRRDDCTFTARPRPLCWTSGNLFWDYTVSVTRDGDPDRFWSEYDPQLFTREQEEEAAGRLLPARVINHRLKPLRRVNSPTVILLRQITLCNFTAL